MPMQFVTLICVYVCVRNSLQCYNWSIWLSHCDSDWSSCVVCWFCFQLSGTEYHGAVFYVWHCRWSVLFCCIFAILLVLS